MKYFIATCSALTFLTQAMASDLKAPIALPSAKVLPKGVRNLSYKHLLSGATDKYNNSSNQVSISDPFFKNITYGDILQGKKNPVDKASVEQMMDALDASENDKLAETTGQVNIKARAQVPVLAYGVSSKTTLAIAVPIISYSMNVDTGAIHSNPEALNQFRAETISRGAYLKTEEFEEKMANPIKSKLEDYNYANLEGEEGTILGDIKLVAKQKVLETEAGHLLSLQAELTLPTGKKANVDKVVNITGGDGQTDIGFGMAHDWSLTADWEISSLVMYTRQLADREEMRVPERVDSKLTPDKEEVYRKLGDSGLFQTSLKWHQHGANAGVGYSFQYKERDQYQGALHESYRYNWLSQETRQRMQALHLSAGYDTIGLYKKGQFMAPLSLLANYTIVTEGKNVVNDPTFSLDFNLYF